jgi:hypothetical protein
MSRNVTPFIDIVRLEDKETKLKAFISAVVTPNAVSDAAPGGDVALLIARSIDSPVVKALGGLIQDHTISGPVKIILAIAPRSGAQDPAADALIAMVRSAGARVVRDQRLFDAHEQLVLGPAASWVGDCMRRDPIKRDAYECYAADCSKTAGWARRSFDRLWEACEPLGEESPVVMPVLVATELLAAVAGEETADGHSGSNSD